MMLIIGFCLKYCHSTGARGCDMAADPFVQDVHIVKSLPSGYDVQQQRA